MKKITLSLLLLSPYITSTNLYGMKKVPTLIILSDQSYNRFFDEKNGIFTKSFKKNHKKFDLFLFPQKNSLTINTLFNQSEALIKLLIEYKMEKRRVCLLSVGEASYNVVSIASQLLDPSNDSFQVVTNNQERQSLRFTLMKNTFKNKHKKIAQEVIERFNLKQPSSLVNYTIKKIPFLIKRLYTMNILKGTNSYTCCNMNVIKKQINLYGQNILTNCLGTTKTKQSHQNIKNVSIITPLPLFDNDFDIQSTFVNLDSNIFKTLGACILEIGYKKATNYSLPLKQIRHMVTQKPDQERLKLKKAFIKKITIE